MKEYGQENQGNIGYDQWSNPNRLTRDIYCSTENDKGIGLADDLGIREEYRDLPGVRKFAQVYADIEQAMEDLPVSGTDERTAELEAEHQVSALMAKRYSAVFEMLYVARELLRDGVL